MNKWILKKSLKGLLHKSLARYGLALSRLDALKGPNLSEAFSNPIQASCYSGVAAYFTVLPIERGRTSRGVSLLQDPRVLSLGEFVEIKDLDEYVSALKPRLLELEETQRRENAADVFGLDSETLVSYPMWAAVLPWVRETPDEKLKRWPEQVLRNRGESGMDVRGMSVEDVMNVDHTDSHARQFFNLKDSIEKIGYQESVGFDEPTAVIFKKSDEWTWMVGPNGNHRIETIASMGYSEVSVRVIQLIDRGYAAFWPNVVRGYFTVEQAQCVFDGIFEGQGKRSRGAFS